MNFEYYMDNFKRFSHIVQELEKNCAKMSQVTDIDSLKQIYKYDCDILFIEARCAMGGVQDNDFTKYHKYYYYGNDKYEVKQLEKVCRKYNKEFRKIKRTYKKCEKLCARIYSDVLQKLYRGQNPQEAISNNERLKLIVEQLKAEAKIKESETKAHEAVIATENAKKADADAKNLAENAKIAQAVAETKKAEAKIKEADAVIASAEEAKAKLAIEQHKTEQLRLRAEERKAAEEEAILSTEERCKIMYNEFLKNLQGDFSGVVRQ